ncbi:SDR family NAD(P)-dependent oxidoreductase [uncultured Paraglaciecola sp.]|uniref:SDR family NAD(P)-dependent oxidoreductase n=1 Tax=uncultured Paraglaciecola sp. TaxID=1765024 RepID=UPI002637182B|nr:SDR family NAD(P)-dependent oxidoreductase [uncultured Paraglaciecola sp.]
MTQMLQDKHIVITGASRGIGLAIAQLFAQHGATLYLLGQSQQTLDSLCDDLSQQFSAQCHAFVADVSDPHSVKQAFNQIFKLNKSLDVLVNNAGVLDDALLGMVNQTQIESTFATNSFSILYTSQYASRLMQRAGGGSIINLASIIGKVGNAGQAVYAGSKAAVIGITLSLAKELAAKQIRVNAIAPGFINTDMTSHLSADITQQRIDSIAMERMGEAKDVANTALYLASDLSAYVTGQVIGVDGGMLI